MDRTSELVTDYEKMQQIYERFQERQALKVEGEWYLVTGEHLMSLPMCWCMAEKEIKIYRENGYTVTPVTIFRKSE